MSRGDKYRWECEAIKDLGSEGAKVDKLREILSGIEKEGDRIQCFVAIIEGADWIGKEFNMLAIAQYAKENLLSKSFVDLGDILYDKDEAKVNFLWTCYVFGDLKDKALMKGMLSNVSVEYLKGFIAQIGGEDRVFDERLVKWARRCGIGDVAQEVIDEGRGGGEACGGAMDVEGEGRVDGVQGEASVVERGGFLEFEGAAFPGPGSSPFVEEGVALGGFGREDGDLGGGARAAHS